MAEENGSTDGPGAGQDSAGSVALDQPAGDVAVVRVSGALDLALAPKLQQTLEHAARSVPRLLVVNLSEVDFLASIGMALLLQAHRERDAGTTVRVVVDNPVVLRPLQLTRLVDELEIVPTEAAALAGGRP